MTGQVGNWWEMVKTPAELVYYLNEDRKFLAHFMAAKDSIIDRTQIPADEKATLKSGDPSLINDLFSRALPPESRKDHDALAFGHDIFMCTN